MSSLKYIHDGDKGFIIFSDHNAHSKIANDLQLKDIISAGFCSFDPDSVSCYGKSTSLGIPSDPKDSERLAKRLRGY